MKFKIAFPQFLGIFLDQHILAYCTSYISSQEGSQDSQDYFLYFLGFFFSLAGTLTQVIWFTCLFVWKQQLDWEELQFDTEVPLLVELFQRDFFQFLSSSMVNFFWMSSLFFINWRLSSFERLRYQRLQWSKTLVKMKLPVLVFWRRLCWVFGTDSLEFCLQCIYTPTQLIQSFSKKY